MAGEVLLYSVTFDTNRVIHRTFEDRIRPCRYPKAGQLELTAQASVGPPKSYYTLLINSVSLFLFAGRMNIRSTEQPPGDICIQSDRLSLISELCFALLQVFKSGTSARCCAVATVMEELLTCSLLPKAELSAHPAAAGARFRLLLLALRYCRHVTSHHLECGAIPRHL